jgi:hypothetical protein
MQAIAPPTEPQLYRTILEGANAVQVWNLARSAMGNSPNELRRCLAEAAESLATLQRDCTATLHAAYLEGATSFEDFIARTRKAQEQVNGRIARLADHPQVALSPRVSLVFRGQGPFDSAALEFGNTVFAVVLPPTGPITGPRPPGPPQP